MLKRGCYFIFFLIVVGCIEPYEFVIRNNEPALVVEAYLSDKSFEDTRSYPSDGRYFSVKLSLSGDVTNVRPKFVKGAHVELNSSDGEGWAYTESEPGVYTLFDAAFAAEPGVRYKLNIRLPDDSMYESNWESLPAASEPAMGAIDFKEHTIQKYAIQANEEVIVTVKGVSAQISIPENTSDAPIYYRWFFFPHWIYIAPLSPSVISPGHKCWVTTPLYLHDYTLQLDNRGGYHKNLFFMETVRNERIFEKFSALIVQHTMTENYYHFWKEMQEQNAGGILDKPPFNLATNFHAVGDDKPISGYFGVVHEQAKRWYFTRKQLSYFVEDTLEKDCTVPFQDPAPECFDCRQYSFGDATETKPSWWQN